MHNIQPSGGTSGALFLLLLLLLLVLVLVLLVLLLLVVVVQLPTLRSFLLSL
jgi:hypothetical protein